MMNWWSTSVSIEVEWIVSTKASLKSKTAQTKGAYVVWGVTWNVNWSATQSHTSSLLWTTIPINCQFTPSFMKLVSLFRFERLVEHSVIWWKLYVPREEGILQIFFFGSIVQRAVTQLQCQVAISSRLTHKSLNHIVIQISNFNFLIILVVFL